MISEIEYAPVASHIVGNSRVNYSTYSDIDLIKIAANKKREGSPQVKQEFVEDLFTSAEGMAIRGVRISDQDAQGRQYKNLLKMAVNVLLSLPDDVAHQTMFGLVQNRGPGDTLGDFQTAIKEEKTHRQEMMKEESI